MKPKKISERSAQNIKNLLEQAYEQMLEQEQVVIGWEKR